MSLCCCGGTISLSRVQEIQQISFTKVNAFCSSCKKMSVHTKHASLFLRLGRKWYILLILVSGEIFVRRNPRSDADVRQLFFRRHRRRGQISLSVSPLQTFPALTNICWQGQNLNLEGYSTWVSSCLFRFCKEKYSSLLASSLMTLQQKTRLIVPDKFYQADLMFEWRAGANLNWSPSLSRPRKS
jgi:hypothetical protein